MRHGRRPARRRRRRDVPGQGARQGPPACLLPRPSGEDRADRASAGSSEDRPFAVRRHRCPRRHAAGARDRARLGIDGPGPPLPGRTAKGRSMEIPLFPLHTVLCPGIVLPLHIFEDRYRALTRHCLDTGAPFGVVLIRDGHEVGPGQLAGAGRGRAPWSRSARPDAIRMAATTCWRPRRAGSPSTRSIRPASRTWWRTSRRSRTRSATRHAPNAWPPRPSAASSATSS